MYLCLLGYINIYLYLHLYDYKFERSVTVLTYT